MQASPWGGHGQGHQRAHLAPSTAGAISYALSLTAYHIARDHMYAQDPKYFCMRGSPCSPLDCWNSAITLKASEVPGHHHCVPLSRVTPALCLSGGVEACCETTGTVEDPWGVPPPHARQVGTTAAAPGLTWSTYSKSSTSRQKKKEYFGSPKYKLSSSLMENYDGDRLDFSSPLAIRILISLGPIWHLWTTFHMV